MLKRAISMMLIIGMLLTCGIQGIFADQQTVATKYSDVSAKHWAANDITKWSDKGLFSGNPDGTFKPNNNLTRAEFCSVINKVFGYTQESSEKFKDIKSTQWFAGIAAKAKSAGYINNWVKDVFNANIPVTREEVAVAMYNAFKLSDVNSSEYLNIYTDLKGYKGAYSDELASIISNGFMSGYPDKTFKVDAKITRAEFVKVLNNAISELYSVAKSYTAAELKGNVIINTSDVTLKDAKIDGNLYLSEGIGEGDVTLENVTVKGQTFINGGGKNSVHLNQSTLAIINVNKANGNIRLVSSGSTITSIISKSGIIMESDPASKSSIPSIIIDNSVPAGQIIDIIGNFESVICNSPGVVLNIKSGSTVNSLTVSEEAKGAILTVAGKITNAIINAPDIKINDKPVQQGSQGAISGTTGVLPTVPAGSTGNSTSGDSNPPAQSDPWTLVWGDEFNGTTLDTDKWRLENSGGGFGNDEQQYYRPDNAVIENGNLVIKAKKEDYDVRDYTSAKLYSKADWKYGKFEAKIKLPVGQGFWPAFWMMPANDTYGGWAASGEIDIMEARGRVPGDVCGTLHYGGVYPSNKYTGKTYNLPDNQSIAEYHTYTAEWEPGEIRWYVDGVLYQTQNNWNTKGANGDEKYSFPAPFDQNFYLMLNLAIGGTFDGGVKPDDSMFPAEMDVDYVRVYELTGRQYKTVVEPSMLGDTLPAGARQPDNTGNLIKDINFEQQPTPIIENAAGDDNKFGEGWNFVHNEQFKGVGTASVEKIGDINFAKINVTDAGLQPYSVQLEQLTTLGKGRWYKYSFDAKADTSRTLSTKLGGGSKCGWAAYSDAYTENLTTEVKSFEHVFQMTRDTDILTRLEYNCASVAGTVWIGNVRVEEVDAPIVDYNASKGPLDASGNNIYNGSFDKYTIDRMSYWNVTKTGAIATLSVPETTRELTAKITDGATDASSITVDQKGIQLNKGNGYSLTFKARADADRTIKVKLASKDGTTIYMPEQEIALTTTTQAIEVPFTMTAENDLESQLIFMLGGNNADVFIDDVSLIQTTKDYTGVDLYPLKNGDFYLGFDSWKQYSIEGGVATFSNENGKAKIDVTNLDSADYKVMLNQEKMAFSRGMEYELSFDASASVTRNITAVVEAGSTRFFNSAVTESPINLTSNVQHFKYDFKMPQDATVDLKFLLGKTSQAAIGTVYIDNVVLQVKDAPAKMPPTLGADTTNNKVGQDMELLFNDNADWRAAISAVKINGTALTTGYTVAAGKLTLNASNFPLGKGYTILVEATGYTPTSVAQNVLLNDGNIIVNGNMSNGNANWGIANYGNGWAGSPDVSSLTFENEIANINVKDRGPDTWSTQFFQEGIPLVAGKSYELTFTGRASIARPIIIEVAGKAYNIILKDTDTVYKKSFTATTNTSLKLNYLLGNVVNGDVTTPTAEHTIYLDDVSIKEVLAAPVLTADSSENKLEHNIDITFTPDNEAWRSALTAVKVDGIALQADKYTASAGQISLNSSAFTTAKSYAIAVEATGYGVNEVVQTIAENVLDTPTLLADSTNNRVGQNIEITFADNVDWRNAITSVKLNGSAMDESLYSVTSGAITITSGAISVANNYTIAVEATGYATTSVSQQVVAEDGNLIVNGDMSTLDTSENTSINTVTGVTNWSKYLNDGSDASISAIDGALLVDFASYDGNNVWSTQVYQSNLSLGAGKTYVLSFDIKSTFANKVIIAKLEDTSNSSIVYKEANVTLTNDMQNCSYEFSVGTDATGKFLFLLGSAYSGAHTITIDNVKLVEKP